MENKELGCCNMLIWDFLVFILFSCIFIPDTVHIVFRVIIGLVAGSIFMLLCSIPVLGAILNIAAGLFWAFSIWLILNIGEWGFVKGDAVWEWTIKILLGFICIGLHCASMLNTDPPRQKNSFSSEYKYAENGWTDDAGTTQDTAEENFHEENESTFHKNDSNDTLNPFAGCKTKASVTRRYRNLSKNFHPDMEDGDMEQMQLLNSLYERKLKEFD